VPVLLQELLGKRSRIYGVNIARPTAHRLNRPRDMLGARLPDVADLDRAFAVAHGALLKTTYLATEALTQEHLGVVLEIAHQAFYLTRHL